MISTLKYRALYLSVALACLGAGQGPVMAASDTPGRAMAAKLPAGMQYVRSVEGIDEYRLQNGLRLLLVPDASKPTTTVNMTYRVGSRHENYGETGMAHLLEHLMFKGSKAHPRLWEEMSQRGVNFNGTTWLDRTNYYETFSANQETLRWAIAMEADRMVNSRISGDDLKTEFSVVRNEMEKNENSSVSMLMQRVVSSAFQWHHYGKDTIGARTDVENVNIPRLQAFWRKYYQPDNATLVVAGAFDARSVVQLVSQQFGKIPAPKRVIEMTYTLDPAQDGERDVTVRRVGDTQAIAALYHTVPAAHADYAATEALALILGDSPNGRLYKALVETKKTVDVFPWAASLEEPGFMLLGANLRREQDSAEAKKVLLETIESFATHPVTEAELNRAKSRLDVDIGQIFNDPEKLAVALSDSVASGDWRLFFLFRDRVKALTVEQVQRVATTWLKSSNRTSGSFIPEEKPDRVPAPAKANVAEELRQFVPGAGIAQAENFDSSPANIDRRTETGSLSNGLQYALLPKTTRGNTVALHFNLYLGDEQSLKGRSVAGELTAMMLNRGTEKLTHQQLTEELDKLKAKLLISGSASNVTVTVDTVREHLPKVLELVRDALRHPAFSAAEFQQVINGQLAQLEESRKDPQALAIDQVQQRLHTWPKDDPRYHQSIDEQIAAFNMATLDQVRAFWTDFYGINDNTQAQLAVVGEFDPIALREQLQTLFGDWKANNHFHRLSQSYQATVPEELKLITPDKANAFFFGAMELPISIHHPDYPALQLGNYLLGGSANSRILNRIRQKDGISYGGGSYFSAASLDEVGRFSVAAIYAPENRTKLEKGMREEIALALKEGFSKAEVEDGKKSMIQQAQLERSQDAGLVAVLARNLYLGRNMQFSAEMEKKIMALSPTQIREAMNRHILYSKLIRVFAGDFK